MEIADDAVIPDVVREFGSLLGAATLLERIANRELERRCGIKYAMFEVLLRLSPTGDACRATMGTLAGQLTFTSGGMTRLIDRMEAQGLVVRTTAEGDRRRQNVAITEAGETKLAEALFVHAETLRRHFAGPLTSEERASLATALRRLRTAAKEELGTLP
ncbi:MarR family winged helix-turn-helix transcriptional regulator [Actinomadura rayongensis]|uniref:MarR family transcriptional regulator n=1 Tax=Actinomadura rayongensis TaxID=1429076 RepID=A0A6I4W0D2_9ACTN|nr:MarR family winged helix-turn-helix transcriptional regulator [Actinomadura rayongensis]MXQ62973.1 MarR family transcriptional regulator [Actinomadura rayongensis]